MNLLALSNSDIFALVILPLLIFIARVLDVSLGTIRLIFVMRGYKFLAPILAFFEMLIWLLAISQIMQNLTNPLYYLAFAGGFAMGNFVGICIENKLALGTSVMQIITQKNASELIQSLKSADYGVTTINAQGVGGPVKVIYTVVKRKDIQNVVGFVKRHNPNAFFLIEEVRSASKEIFPLLKSSHKRSFLSSFILKRK